jgi:hypothetical protein
LISFLPVIALALSMTMQRIQHTEQSIQLVASPSGQYASIHHPPIGPGRPCDSASVSDPYVNLICTDDRLAEDWLTLNQAGYALRYQLGDDVYLPLMRAEGAAAWTDLKYSCPLTSPLTAAARSAAVSCIEGQIEAAWDKKPWAIDTDRR